LPSHLAADVLCTIAALFILEEFFSDKEDEWQLLAKKARDFVKSQGVSLKQELDNMSNLV
jgi:hypothetical protein